MVNGNTYTGLRSSTLLIVLSCAALMGCSSSSADPDIGDSGSSVAALPDAAVSTDAGTAPMCSTGPGGTEVGDLVADLGIRNCAGETVALRSAACGALLTLIDIGTATMPPCVQATDEYATGADYNALKANGLRIVQVFREDETGGLPTKSWCADYKTKYAVDFKFLVDPLHSTDDLMLPLPLNIVVDQTGVILNIWSGALPDDKLEQLSAMLNAQKAL